MKPLYGLSESGDLWNAALDRHHRKYLKMKLLASDQALFAEYDGRKLIGMNELYVEDL